MLLLDDVPPIYPKDRHDDQDDSKLQVSLVIFVVVALALVANVYWIWRWVNG